MHSILAVRVHTRYLLDRRRGLFNTEIAWSTSQHHTSTPIATSIVLSSPTQLQQPPIEPNRCHAPNLSLNPGTSASAFRSSGHHRHHMLLRSITTSPLPQQWQRRRGCHQQSASQFPTPRLCSKQRTTTPSQQRWRRMMLDRPARQR